MFASMMAGRFFLVLPLLVVSFSPTSEAVTCYDCNSAKSSNCLEPFNPSGVGTCSDKTCYYLKSYVNGETVVLRGCLPATISSPCQSGSQGEYSGTMCYCNSDRCNGASIDLPNGSNQNTHNDANIPNSISRFSVILVASVCTCLVATKWFN